MTPSVLPFHLGASCSQRTGCRCVPLGEWTDGMRRRPNNLCIADVGWANEREDRATESASKPGRGEWR
jgi:endogenous inhibitor of DNA gyrase (YacG/DUF329 family)